MSKKNILVAIPVNESQKAALEAAYPDGRFTYNQLPSENDVKGIEIILGDVPLNILKYATKLEWLQLSSSGADDCTKEGVLKPGTMLTCSTGAFGLAISEYLLTGTLVLLRDFKHFLENQMNCEWQQEGNAASDDGSYTLVVGFGNIGSEYGRKMKALGSHVVGIRKHIGPKPEWLDGLYDMSSLETELQKADIVALTLPNTPGTIHLMNMDKFKLMKKNAIILNAGRGSAIVTDDLCKALKEGLISGACLDVTDPEPLPPDHPLWSMENVIITPHISGYINRKYDNIFKIIYENFKRYGEGKPLFNQVDFKTGYRKYQ